MFPAEDLLLPFERPVGFSTARRCMRCAVGRVLLILTVLAVMRVLSALAFQQCPLSRSGSCVLRVPQSAFPGGGVSSAPSGCSARPWTSLKMSVSAFASSGGPSSAGVGSPPSGSWEFSPPTHPAFTLVSNRFVSEYSMHVVEYRHNKTNALVTSLSVPATESEMVFMASFRTPIEDSTGTPHILEHSVLMGSEHFPLKEPFVALMKSSVNTYLNALTYQDRTCYPVASANVKDFYNLASVYMDAVFRPKAVSDHLIFRQEGWRSQLTPGTNASLASPHAADESSVSTEAVEAELEKQRRLGQACLDSLADCSLELQGVVLSEMKGVYSSPLSVSSRLRQRALFPDLPAYAHDSGGDPACIPSLSYEAFKAFHKTRYHPANSRLYFWGADDVARRLEFVHQNLAGLEDWPAPPDTSIGLQRRFAGWVFLPRSKRFSNGEALSLSLGEVWYFSLLRFFVRPLQRPCGSRRRPPLLPIVWKTS